VIILRTMWALVESAIPITLDRGVAPSWAADVAGPGV